MLLKIGELAKRIGLTIRALHHYEEIGLVQPSARTAAGYRLYDRNDIARLHRIQALRGLGLSLAQTREMMNGAGGDLRGVIRKQMTFLDQQIIEITDLRERLGALEDKLAGENEPDLDEWLSTIRLMATQRKYFTPEEMAAIHKRKGSNDDKQQWLNLIGAVRKLMDNGTPPCDAQAKILARNWLDLSKKTMGDDPRFFAKLAAMHRTEFAAQALTGVDGPMLDFIMHSIHEIRFDIFARYLDSHEIKHYRAQAIKHLQDWLDVFADTRQLMESGVLPSQPQALDLMRRWRYLINDTWGKNPSTLEKVRIAHEKHPELMDGSGFNADMRRFVDQGMLALASSPGKD